MNSMNTAEEKYSTGTGGLSFHRNNPGNIAIAFFSLKFTE